MGYREGKLEDYVADAAARKPAPGGGSVSALAGALAVAMSEMAANFTVGKKKFAAVEAEVQQLLGALGPLRARLLQLVDQDVAAYAAVDGAYALPRDTPDQAAHRQRAIGEALRAAMQAPLEVMRCCDRVATIADRLADAGNPNLITDVGVSAILAEGACEAARLNVEVNLKFLDDAALSDDAGREMDRLSRNVRERRANVERKVAAYLKA